MKKVLTIVIICLGTNLLVCAQNWVQVGDGLGSLVYTLYPDSLSGKLFLGGQFQGHSNGGFYANCIASWDGNAFDSLDGGMGIGGGYVTSIINYQNQIYISGNFFRASHKITNAFTRWNGTSWDSLNLAFHGPASFCEYHNLLFCIGSFDSVGNCYSPKIVAWDGTNWIPIGLPAHVGLIQSDVGPCIEFQNELYVGGFFYDSLTNSSFSLLRWNGNSWQKDWYNFTTINRHFAVFQNELYVGGEYFSGPCWSIVKYDGASFSCVGGGINGLVENLKIIGDKLYAVGYFDHADADYQQSGGIPASCIAIWDGNNWSALSQDIFHTGSSMAGILDIAAYNNELYVGGSFSMINNDTVNKIAKYQGWYLGENDLKKKKEAVEVYPIPASTTLTLYRSTLSTNSPNSQLIITDVFGRIVFSQLLNQSTNPTESTNTTIDISKLNNGIYFYEVKGTNESARGKFIVLH